jgi:hypothetical protein
LAGERDYNSRIPATLSRLRQILIRDGSLGAREIGAVGDRFEHVLMLKPTTITRRHCADLTI